MSPEKHLTHETRAMPWEATGTPGVERKQLGSRIGSSDYDASLVRMAPGARLPDLREGWGIEVFMLAGQWNLPEGPLEVGGFARRPAQHLGNDSTTTGCTFFLRAVLFAEEDRDLVHCQSDEEAWSTGRRASASCPTAIGAARRS